MSGKPRKSAENSPRAIKPRHGTAAVLAAWPDDVANKIARRIAWFLDLRGYTQEVLAARAGLSQSAVNDALSGQTNMDMRTLFTLAAALDCTPSVLLGDADRSAEAMAADAERRRF